MIIRKALTAFIAVLFVCASAHAADKMPWYKRILKKSEKPATQVVLPPPAEERQSYNEDKSWKEDEEIDREAAEEGEDVEDIAPADLVEAAGGSEGPSVANPVGAPMAPPSAPQGAPTAPRSSVPTPPALPPASNYPIFHSASGGSPLPPSNPANGPKEPPPPPKAPPSAND